MINISAFAFLLLLPVSPIARNLRCHPQDPRGLFQDPGLTNCSVRERTLHCRTLCLIQPKLAIHSLLVKPQRVGALEISSAKQTLLPQRLLVVCSDQMSILLRHRQQICLAIQARPEVVLSLAVAAAEEVVVAATCSAEGRTNRPVELVLVGALARCRATIMLEDFLALGSQDNKIIHLRVASRLHLDSLASLRRANPQKQQRLDQVKRLVYSVA